MPRLTEAQIIRMLKNEYRQRLIETLGEAEVFDDDGNNLLSPGLKVRHKDSKFEYTVDSVEGEEDSGDVKISLKLPDEPRFDPPEEQTAVIADEKDFVLGENDPGQKVRVHTPSDYEDTAELSPDGIRLTVGPGHGEEETEFIIDQEEFEKEYEVT